MTDIPPSHPRYHSLVARERLVEGVRRGLTSQAGLIAHGRGEAFDYLMGERTTEEAMAAERVAAAMLCLADRPVVSVNGNVAALAAEQVVELQRRVTEERTGRGRDAPELLVEVNLFHRTPERVALIGDHLRDLGARGVLGEDPDDRVPGLDHARGLCASEGVGSADVVLIPLEDGDRAEALRACGRTVIAIDLNPLARTSLSAHVTIVDELTRAVPALITAVTDLSSHDDERLRSMLEEWDNEANLGKVLRRISERLEAMDIGVPGDGTGPDEGDSV
jgi:4-phosphopantoate--beta-alanine ligase